MKIQEDSEDITS